jgi:FO synthase
VSLYARAAAVRDRAFGRRVTYSPKVFLPLTNLCRDRCDYCSFRRSPGEPGEWTMTPDEVRATLARGRELGCTEALFCLGDRPDVFPTYRALLRSWGHESTIDYLEWGCREAIAAGLLPHTNAGVMSMDDMRRLRGKNASLGLMVEQVTPRLCERGGAHHHAPDKRPEARLRMLREAGALRIPMTTGILCGIGESRDERIDSLLAITELHAAYGHIQEVIVQGFRDGRARGVAEPEDDIVADAIALARVMLPPEVTVQSPPNLVTDVPLLLAAGVNDLGGISPLTPDYINKAYPWPNIRGLAEVCAQHGFELAPRLPVHERWRGWTGLELAA